MSKGSDIAAEDPSRYSVSELVYRIRAVDGDDEEVAEILRDLHQWTFFGTAAVPQFGSGSWWLAHDGAKAVAFAGVVPSTHARNSGYLCRVGVLQKHQGRGLQRRLMRAVEVQARRIGWESIVSDTTDNRISANNFIRTGYRLYEPEVPWGWRNTLYWRKWLNRV
ncbi:GNAT family N-acetyltransferase [Bradyrhizobium sp. CCGUVB1N3]|uniref:GNAT family N-acetyltransferase n=1 Tax=Bradyrhizobium sp. CCGUVB1N3 TaxID=2949629 RepID=UPI0020B22317|nr:GNAT family N-acetyltransferase [Bradyrhizobium sp. CCGUVB1N3]MCP3476999.1 GNAT family N-acetyltransferase [Bradyrhizobium sp. CCGUVB1N3]